MIHDVSKFASGELSAEFERMSEALQRLENMGSPEDIAAYFQRRKILGRPGGPQSCPVARYLTVTLGSVHNVGTYNTSVTEVLTHVYRHGPNVSGFIDRFDHRDYPDLIIESEKD